MAKVCSICNTENRDDAQFCRGCGTPLATVATRVVAPPTAAPAVPATPAVPVAPTDTVAAGPGYGVTCEECGFFNRAGVRLCAQCGADLFSPQNKTVLAPPMQAGAGLSVAPPMAPGRDGPGAEETFDIDRDSVPDIPDADATIAVTQQRPAVSQATVASDPVASPSMRNRTPLWIGLGVAVVAAAGAAWWFLMGSVASTPEPGPGPAASAVVFVPPVAASAPASSPFASLTDSGAAASASASSASGVDILSTGGASVTSTGPSSASSTTPSMPASTPILTPFSASTPIVSNPPVAASIPTTSPFATLSQGDRPATGASAPAVDPVAKAAAEKRARERTAREKADREAKAKVLAEQREQAAARQKAEQELTKRRAEEAIRLRGGGTPTAPVPTPVLTPPQPKTVRDLCNGKGFIGQPLCEARECTSPAHANETVCRQLKETQERRQNYNN